MNPVSKRSLQAIMAEFPSVRWPDTVLDELVSPAFGVITGFQGFLDEVATLMAIDLGDTGVADLRLRR